MNLLYEALTTILRVVAFVFVAAVVAYTAGWMAGWFVVGLRAVTG